LPCCYCYCCCCRLELVVDPQSAPHRAAGLDSCTACTRPKYPACEGVVSRTTQDARRVKVEPSAPGGDQLVPNRRRRLPLTLPCACALLLVHKPPRKLAHRRFYHSIYPFACLCLASSSESSIFLLFTPCICSSSRHSLDWLELYICLARTTPPHH
jgi:hypothetical protein